VVKIVARIPKEDVALTKALKKKGVKAKVVRNATIIHLPLYNPKDPESKIWSLADIPNDAALLIDDSEDGGQIQPGLGAAKVVAGLSGKKLRPYYIPKKDGPRHCFFAILGRSITVTGFNDAHVIVRKHEIDTGAASCWVNTTIVFEGQFTELPENLSRYAPASEAAIEKACCQVCRHRHYAEDIPKRTPPEPTTPEPAQVEASA
jgi:hypothetical protein